MDLRALQSSIDLSREAALTMNEAWCLDAPYPRAVKLAEAEQALVDALAALRKVRTPIREEASPLFAVACEIVRAAQPRIAA